jgi:hypothetical protein
MNAMKEGDDIAVVCLSKNRSDGRIDINQDSGFKISPEFDYVCVF